MAMLGPLYLFQDTVYIYSPMKLSLPALLCLVSPLVCATTSPTTPHITAITTKSLILHLVFSSSP